MLSGIDQPLQNFYGFTDWLHCINRTRLLVDFLEEAEKIMNYPRQDSSAYIDCMSDQSLNLWSCKHWASKSSQCSKFDFEANAYTIVISIMIAAVGLGVVCICFYIWQVVIYYTIDKIINYD